MDQVLKGAAESGDINMLYALIRQDPFVLDRIDHIPFVETPLHVAASLGHTRFAAEIMRLRPSFSKKLDQDGFTPLHLAIYAKRGNEHDSSTSEEGNLELLTRFSSVVCPSSTQDVTIKNETALHIAVKTINSMLSISW
ncbi:hypothetical protein TIFTF001_002957 [Ficus carica]|uniref:Uncharacterized protein n=1 Tax=Ficus carica TaxID=3494 RepID=A0AA87ZQ96_FICCA|nr:hypothetical protein TIFTF001_002957 [Ficus carica]